MTPARTCPWCNGKYDLAMKDGHLTCPECHWFLVKKDDPEWEEGFAARIGKDEYWMLPDNNPLKVIQ